MTGILVQLAISQIILWFDGKMSLSVLGFRPTKERLKDFFICFLITAIFCASGPLMKMIFGNQQWTLNPDLTAEVFFSGIWWNIKSVLFEELIFRGVLLYLLIKYVGPQKAIIISAIAFGIYHWFSFGVIGNPIGMAVTFAMTGTMGLVLAYGYAKTFSLYIPFAIHLGWNLTQIFVFSGGPIGPGLFISSSPDGFRTDSYTVFIVVTFLPVLLALLVNYLLIKNHRQADIELHRNGQNSTITTH